MTDAALDAFMAVVARAGWSGASLDQVAAASGMTVAELYAVLGDRWDALRHAGERYDRAALAVAGLDDMLSVRDRLFDALMARFDAMQPHRPAIAELMAAALRDPGLAGFFGLYVPRSVGRIADACGMRTTGWLGAAKLRVLSLLYLRVTRAWLADDTADLSRTMKALDDALARAEALASRFGGISQASAAAPGSLDGPPRVSVH